MVEAASHLKLLPASILDIYKVFDHIGMLSIGVWYQPYTLIPTLLGSDFGVLGHLWNQMITLGHGWGWQPPQTASHIHIRHLKSVWAHWYAVHRHALSALHSYTHPTWLRFWVSGSLVESKWCDYLMVEADSHLKLLPTSILDIYKVIWHIDMLYRHMVAALHSYTHPTWLWFLGSGSLVESKWCDYVMVEADSHLKLLPTSI